MRLAAIVSHPIQYYSPIFRELAFRCDLRVFYAQHIKPHHHASSGFGVAFEWDADLLNGYECTFLDNIARVPSPDSFFGSDTPEIARHLKNGGFDAVLVFGWYLKSFLQAIWAAKRFRLPLLIRGDSQLPTPRAAAKALAKTICYPRFLRVFDAALYTGKRSRDYYRHYAVPEECLFFSPHCVDNGWFAGRAGQAARDRLRQHLEIEPGETALLFAGKLVPFKRPQDLFLAARKCLEQGLRIRTLIAGAGQLESELRNLAVRLQVPAHFLGFRNQSEMPAAYAASDILVLPSGGRETWGLVANEALACGRPIIVSDQCGCAPDLAEDGHAGRVFSHGDLESLSDAIAALASSPPSASTINAKVQLYSPAAAASGILAAANFAKERRGLRQGQPSTQFAN